MVRISLLENWPKILAAFRIASSKSTAPYPERILAYGATIHQSTVFVSSLFPQNQKKVPARYLFCSFRSLNKNNRCYFFLQHIAITKSLYFS